mmetsp:Transcript_20353/g.26289  ORF Transcript_20353/g.26289 Transcript_20353/m.26289 type:complete len:680 (+) Transcript_20353:217-2256(+)
MGNGITSVQTKRTKQPKIEIQKSLREIDNDRGTFTSINLNSKMFRYGSRRSSTGEQTTSRMVTVRAIDLKEDFEEPYQGNQMASTYLDSLPETPVMSSSGYSMNSTFGLEEEANNEVESLYKSSIRVPNTVNKENLRSLKLDSPKYSAEQRVDCCVDQKKGTWKPAFVAEVIDAHHFKLLFDDGTSKIVKGRHLRTRVVDRLAMVTAASYGFKNVIQSWYDTYGNVDAVDEDAATALHRACERGHLALVRYLVERCRARSDIKLPEGSIYAGATAFDMAFVQGQTKVIQYALNWKLGFEILDINGNRRRQAINAKFVDGRGEGLQDFQGADFMVGSFLCRASLVKKFYESLGSQIPELSSEHIKVLRVEDFLEAKCFLSFAECEKRGIHVSGDEVLQATELGHEILLISHQWGNSDLIDEGEWQYQLTCSFLSGRLRGQFKYVWSRYSCWEAPEDGHECNLPAMLMLASCCLIIPEVAEVDVAPGLNEKILGSKVTNLRSLVKDDRCLVETLSSLASGQNVYVAYKFGDEIEEFQRVTSWEIFQDEDAFLQNANLYNGFHLGAIHSLPKNMLVQRRKRLWKNCLQDWWQIRIDEDPLRTLHNVVMVVLQMVKQTDLLQRICLFQVTPGDIETSGLRDDNLNYITLSEVLQNVGNVNEKRFLEQIRILLVLIAFCMDKIS